MSHFAVHYQYVADASLLDRHRPAHREFLRSLVGSGVVAAGAYPGAAEPSALLIVEAGTEEDVASMLDADPFLLEGAIAARRIQLWNPPIGIFA
ncbi:YciI family protein [Tessaracoccus sp.]